MMKTLRSISGFHDTDRLRGHEKGHFFISLDSPTIGDQNRPRTRSTVTIWHLPDSVLVTLLKGLHIKDLLSFRSVHPYFRGIIDTNSTLWTCVSFAEAWPTISNAHHFIRASKCGNIEATIKLAVSCLYKEGLTKDDIAGVGHEAAKHLCHAEALTPNTFPFFWIFIRPPWAPDGSCCKVQAFQRVKEIVDETGNKDLAFGVALTMKLQRLSVHGFDKEEEKKYFQMAMDQCSAPAIFFSLLDTIPDETDAAKELERIRLLRHLATANILEAKLNLVKGYIQGRYGGLSESMAKEYVQDFFASSRPSKIHLVFSNGLTSDISRYILVDWLVEVVGMKDFSAHTLYLAVSMFDRFLQVRNVQRSQVQLLGVAAMVISSRFLGFDILTIREAAWLTDNSYSYHDVVKMMGELVAAVKGNIRVFTIQDYVKVLIAMAGESGYVAMLVEYIAMLCLLQSEMGQYGPAEIAASCLLLTRLLMNKENPWPEELQEWTGLSQEYLGLCTFHIHKKCLLEGAEVDYRDTKLQAVKMRYADPNRFSVSNIEVIGHRELCRRLGVTQYVNHGKNTKAIRFRNTDELIVSPRRGRKRSRLSVSFKDDVVDRNSTATPPIRAAYAFDESVSGYDGDLEEDSDESMSEKSDVLFELNDESFISEPSEDNQEWDNEQSSMDEETSLDVESEDIDCTSSSISVTTGFHEFRESNLACLSSLCQFGNNVNCRALGSSPSCCISKCSCQQSHIPAELTPARTCSGMNSVGKFSSTTSSTSKSSLSTFESCRQSFVPSGAKSRLLMTQDTSVLNPCSVVPGVPGPSPDIAGSLSSCDTQGSVQYQDCDVHLNRLGIVNHFSLHSSNQHINSPFFKGACERTTNTCSQSLSFNIGTGSGHPHNSPDDVEFPLELALSSTEINACTPKQKLEVIHSTLISPESGSLINNMPIPRKSKRLTISPQQSFTRLCGHPTSEHPHEKSSFLFSTPSSSTDCQFCVLRPEIYIPCTPETDSEKLFHTHFTRSNSAFRIVPSTSSSCGLSEQSLSDRNISLSKKNTERASHLSLRNIIKTEVMDETRKCSSSAHSATAADSDCQEKLKYGSHKKRKRKL